jgi:hypothetical protein
VVGNPFRPTPVDPPWLTSRVVACAQAASDGRELPTGALSTNRPAVVADALEEAGCTGPDLLTTSAAGGRTFAAAGFWTRS